MNYFAPYYLLFLFGFVATEAIADQISDGKKLAEQCKSCHGEKGISPAPQWPNLAGQQPDYLANQLRAFRSGARTNQTMQAKAENLTDEEINSLAAYFASLPAKSAGGDKQLADAGKSKFSMCTGCHGAKAEGRGNFPRLAGQHPAYIVRQLQSFKKGTRNGGPMQAIASGLNSDEINALAAYLGTLK